MCQLERLAQTVNAQAQTLSRSWHDGKDHSLSSCDVRRTNIPPLDSEGEEARNQLLAAIRSLEQLVLGPKDTIQSFYYKSAEAGVIQALCQLQVPRYVPLYGAISYADLAKRAGISEDRLKHMVRIAAVCSNFLAETEDGQVRHSENSLIWQLDPLVATGMEVMFDHLPQSSFKLADVCAQDPTDEKQEVCGFSLARDQPLYSYLETHPVEGRNFAAHMRAQAVQYGDSSVQACYDWSALKGKTLVDCGGSFGSVAAAIVRKEPTIKCIVQDLPKVIDSAIKATAQDPKFPLDSISFQAHSFMEKQPVLADVYLFRMVFHNWSDIGARQILQALRPALRPGARVICVEYVMPPIGTAPSYAELATRRLDNTMYTLMKGKVRELTEFKELFASVEPDLAFTSFKPGQLKATHDPRCHSMMEWVYKPMSALTDPEALSSPVSATTASEAFSSPVSASTDPEALSEPMSASSDADALSSPMSAPTEPDAPSEPMSATTEPDALSEAMKATIEPEALPEPMKATIEPEAHSEPMKASTEPEAPSKPMSVTTEPEALSSLMKASDEPESLSEPMSVTTAPEALSSEPMSATIDPEALSSKPMSAVTDPEALSKI